MSKIKLDIESDNLYRDLFEKNQNVILLINKATGDIVHANKAACNYYGYSYEQLTSLNIYVITIVNEEETQFKMENNRQNLTHRLSNNELRKVVVSNTPIIINNIELWYSIIMDVENIKTELDLVKEDANKKILKTKNQLQLILDSTVEAIFGMDIEGKCTFCNASGLKMLGYKNQEELLGKNMHYLIHHTYKDGREMPFSECKIYRALLKGEGVQVDDEVFWRADGSSFDVNYYSHPQFENGDIVGAVVTFTDISVRKKYEEHIEYISYHDTLTGLYNRKYFEDELHRSDDEDTLPLSIIYGDVNGLKLTNDVFGHSAGNELLKSVAKTLVRICRDTDIIARVGGDEFAILLKKTDAKEVKQIVEKIKKEFDKENFSIIKISISLGYDTKTNNSQVIGKVLDNAEGMMYKEKILSRRKISEDMVSTLIQTLHSKSDYEKQHSSNVADLCYKMGVLMGKTETELRKLKEAGYLHDIGKIAVNKNILNKKGALTKDEKEQMNQHVVVGYRILNLFDHTLDLAEVILNHHEYWDGFGYPKGISGDEIPEMARIISVAEVYDTIMYKYKNREYAIDEIKNNSGKKFDPHIVEIFLKMMESTDF